MKVTPITTPVVHAGDDLLSLIRQSVTSVPERSVLVVTSKIIALCENAVASKVTGEKEEKQAIVRQEAECYLEPDQSKYNLMLTIIHNILAVNAGIDESNADNQYVLLPKKPYESAQKIWKFVRTEYKLKEVGVLITDSKTFPLKWGTIGTALAHCGFRALNNKIGEKDLFGHEMQMTQVNVAEGLAAAAVLEMGEVAECQPLCLIENAEMVVFQGHPPTVQEIKNSKISITEDVYAPVLTKANWKRGSESAN